MGKFLQRLGDFLLAKALVSECRQAGLVVASAQLPIGHVEYLHSKDANTHLSEAIVMLHGATSDRTSWPRFAKHLDSKLPLVIPDLPGHGKSIANTHLDYSIQGQSEHLKTLLATLGIHRVHLIGNSMGGAIAIHFAAANPNLVASLVLMDAAGIESSPSWLQQHITKTGCNPIIEVNNTTEYRKMLRIIMQSQPYIPSFILASLTRAYLKRKPINQKIIAAIAQDLDQTTHLKNITVPSLIIWGAEDRILHVDDATFLHQQLPNSRKIILENIGHTPMVEAPKQVATICKTFYAEMLSLS